MSLHTENTQAELEYLKGCVIEGVKLTPSTILLTLRYPADLQINGADEGLYEIWADAEGNGPGYIALVGHPD